MRAGITIETGVPFTITIPIAKAGVNTSARTARGIMTQEVVDAHGEEVDYESVKACIDTWRGNLREMHERKAVGRALDIQFDDANKAVELEAYVSRGAEDTWQKVQDGTLGYYSIGGIGDRITGRRSDGTIGPRVLMRSINEVSLVDSGACPTATVSVVKLIGNVPVAQLGIVRAADVPAIVAAVHAALAPLKASFEARINEQRAASAVTISKLRDSLRGISANAAPGNAPIPPNYKLIDKTIGVFGEPDRSQDAQLAKDIAAIGPDSSEADRLEVVERMLAHGYRSGIGVALPR